MYILYIYTYIYTYISIHTYIYIYIYNMYICIYVDIDTWINMYPAWKLLKLRYATCLHWSLTQFTPASMEVYPTNVSWMEPELIQGRPPGMLWNMRLFSGEVYVEPCRTNLTCSIAMVFSWWVCHGIYLENAKYSLRLCVVYVHEIHNSFPQ